MVDRMTVTPYPPEVRARAVRMVQEGRCEHGSNWAAICSVAGKIGCTGETLRRWVLQAERDQGLRAGATSQEGERIRGKPPVAAVWPGVRRLTERALRGHEKAPPERGQVHGKLAGAGLIG